MRRYAGSFLGDGPSTNNSRSRSLSASREPVRDPPGVAIAIMDAGRGSLSALTSAQSS